MICLALPLHCGLLFHAIETFIMAYYPSLPLASTQGHFPRLENVGAFKNISIVPTQATCGLSERKAFCQSSIAVESIHSCTQEFCSQECPYRSSPASYIVMLSDGLGICITRDKNDLHPGSSNNLSSFIFHNLQSCFSTPHAQKLATSFTLTVWLKPEKEGVMCVVDKALDGQTVFKLTISEKETMFYYRTVNGLQPPIKVMTLGRILVKKWNHLSVQVHHIKISFFINGLEDDNTAFDSRILTGLIADPSVEGEWRVGQNLNGSEQFVGRMQDFRLYQLALTNRDIFEVWSGRFLQLHSQSECRCPGSHPRVHPLVHRYCIPNIADDTTNDRVLRLNPEAHPLSYINDNDIGTSWISSVFNTIEQVNRGIIITIDLENGQYQVFYIILQFFSPQPAAVHIQRKKQYNSDWEDWQYIARDCSVFGMENNGSLEYPDSVNCLQLPSFTPYSRGNITFSVLTPEPNRRPGYNDFYNTPSLQEFVKASQIKIHLLGQYHTTVPWIDFRHRYYGVDEITVSGRCNCLGHADHCDTTTNPYRCLCSEESYTEGNNCDHCWPLYNDKPFHPGDQVHAYNCKPCQCYGHAISCHYNRTMDSFPNEHHRGGGGVCDDCQHNTTGRNCELCKDFFFQHVDADLSALDVCKPCECNIAGTTNSSQLCDGIGGQCNCKRHVSGRQCNQCQEGFYNLQQSDPGGCSPCNCNTSGTVNGDITCHQNSGQCKCKENVIGLRCEHCNFGYKHLLNSKKGGCVSCQCSIYGSVNDFCNPSTGQCNCKEYIKGLYCDTCTDGFYGLDDLGCKSCDCHISGSVSGTVCDPKTGQCDCKPNFGERQCSECLDGYYRMQLNDSLACVPCNCDKAGTVNSSIMCDKSTGQCHCKAGAMGLQCSQCMPHTYNLTAENLLGCDICNCDPLGTLPETFCNQINGQCVCLPRHQGRRCHKCKPGFYFSQHRVNGCSPCLCHPTGSVDEICNSRTGQCVCQDYSVAGTRCDHCRNYYYGFNAETGRCQHCNCHPAGAINGTCHPMTGQCMCKQFATGSKCDNCVLDASNLDVHNLFGCSKTPSQQPPPGEQALNSSAIRLFWNPPDSPNSNQLAYNLYRNESQIYTTEDSYPYRTQIFTDTNLLPYTFYSYHLETSNVHGSTKSAALTYRTQPGIPAGNLHLNPVVPVGPHSVSLHWTALSNDSGPIEKYVLTCISSLDLKPCGQYEGLETSATIWNLVPFTKYSFSVQACTSGGCLLSQQVAVVTAQAPPEEQEPPVIHPISSTEFVVEWAPPRKANGVIIRYELYMRRALQSDENHISPENRVFQTSGWFSPQPLLESPNENALTPPLTSINITDLEPFTEYEFRILSVNMAGSTFSNWTSERTAEAAPVFMPSPSVFPLSPYSLNVSWEKPRDNEARGEVMGYSVNVITEQKVLPVLSQVLLLLAVLYIAEAHEQSYIVTGLEPYRMYYFTITLCNRIGCGSSEPGMGQTLPAAPRQLIAPYAEGVNSTVIKISWNEPKELNGPFPIYQLERMDTSLTSSNVTVTKGIRFPGNGYYKFPSSTLPANTYFTGIKVSFRTTELDGLILFSISPGNQEEYIALQLQSGRPYFLFDPQGSAVALTPDNDGGRQYNDNSWHHIIAVRNQALGTITVDGQFTGSSSATSGSTIIGENTGVFVGGLPRGFTIIRKDTGSTKIVRKGFVGCLRDVLLKMMHHPYEIWKPLEWKEAVEKLNVYHSWEGCPSVLTNGAHFLGKGFLELHSSTFHGGLDTEISFIFKTDQLNGLLLFIYNKNGPDYIAVELKSGILSFRLKNGIVSTRVNLWLGLSYCDGKWNTILLKKEGAIVSASMNKLIEHVVEPDLEQLFVNSPVYIGGIPDEVQNVFKELGLEEGFGGCMKDVKFTRGAVVNLASVSSNVVRVNLDGCLSTDSAVNCRGNDSILVYRGKEKSVYESGLQPFTEYLYRVVASNEGGSVSSAWNRSRTREAVPRNVPTPSRVHCINGYSVEVAWDEPAGVKGVIEKYILKAANEDGPRISTVTAEITNTSAFTGMLTGLRPFANYAITLTACTLAGCTESSHALNISTPQEAPQNVQPPAAISFPTSLFLSWAPPKTPNGIIIKYSLYMDAQLIYTGNETKHIVRGLRVFTAYQFLITACTIVGCTNSSQVILLTAQLPPSHVDAPILTVLDSKTIYAQWKAPEEVNGNLLGYILYINSDDTNDSSWNVIYNSSYLFRDYTVQQLFPGTVYFIKLAACTGGGCTISEATSAVTTESTPEGVPAPEAQSYSSDSFNISWTKPEYPNGFITSYGLCMNGILVQNSSQMSYYTSGLSPWSLHSFRVQACTAKGCALGPLVEARTLEDIPKGKIVIFVINDGSRKVRVKWHPPHEPNGDIIYAVLFTGIFYADEDNGNYTILNGTQILYTTKEANIWVSISGLIPFSNYTVEVNASNSQGYVISEPVTIAIPPGAPDGMLPPRLSSAMPTSLQVVWSIPVRNNAPGLPSYRLQMRPSHSPEDILELFSKPTASLNYVVTDLQPYTSYEIRVIACNGYGDTYSDWTLMVTAEDEPGPIDPPLLLDVKSREVTISWQHPSKPNGIITHYNIYQNEQLHTTIPGITSKCIVHDLHPYTMYQFQVEGCTSKGCSLSPETLPIQTLPDAPEDIPAPELYSDTPTSVQVSWQSPLHPNGLVQNITIERRVKGTQQISTIATLPFNYSKSYLDQSPALSPWKMYEYRILANTFEGGINSSAWAEVITRPSRPAGIQPPKVQVLGPDTAQVFWQDPFIPNGEVLSYEIRMPDPRITLTKNMSSSMSHIVTNLIPFTNYSVTIVVCSGGGGYFGGCTESLPTYMITHPTLPQSISPLSVTTISESFIAASWQPPARPNGPNIRYELLRRKIQQPLASNPPEDLNRWHNIYSGTQWFYEDKGLSRYTTYEYKLIVHNDVGYTSGEEVVATTLAGFPKKASNVTGWPLNHTAIEVKWTIPTLQDLQGSIEYYLLFWNDTVHGNSRKIPAGENHAFIGELHPNTEYQILLHIFNGVHSITSEAVHVTTLDGEPEGMFPPEVVIINSTAVRVIWTSPSNPNGVVTEYSVYVNNKRYETGMKTPGSFLLGDLSPFTIYDIQVEVCTVYACVISNGTQITTVEDEPKELSAPQIHVLGPRALQINWASPGQPNGIILGYDLLRKAHHRCSVAQQQSNHRSGGACLSLECDINENICGEQCYNPQFKVCCNGILHNSTPGFQCCEDKYLHINTSGVCCGGQMHAVQSDYECCGGYYTRVMAGEICCPNEENWASVGIGDSCCQGIPYSVSGNQICCGGLLHDGYNQQCCGGKIVSKDFICCGTKENGTVYQSTSGMFCCGHEYVNMSSTICCTSSSGESKAHIKKNDPTPLKCCETELIPKSEECCNGLGYNPLKYVCSDRISAGMTMKVKEECKASTLCPISMEATAYCGQCDFDKHAHICSWIKSSWGNSRNKEDEGMCPALEEKVYTGGGPLNILSFLDQNLEPYVTYEYRVAAWNKYGKSLSEIGSATTKQDVPEGISPPQWTKVDNREDIIFLNWEEPRHLNGIIIHYIILRNGVERFRGKELSFMDTSGIQPYQEYIYQLRACTVAGCADSSKVVAVTVQGVPESVQPPTVTALSATALHLSWTAPRKPNGIIREYQISQTGKGLIHSDTAGKMQHTVSGLHPHRNYSFTLAACTFVGCTSSQASSSRTLQASPQGVWSQPRHIIISSTIVEVYWDEPEQPNGIISLYRLFRNGEEIFNGGERNLNFTDSDLQPNRRYVYQLEASTWGGSNTSDKYIIQTPLATPEEIPIPYNVTTIDAYSIFVAWDPPGSFKINVPLKYNVLLNAGSTSSLVKPVGQPTFTLLDGLDPYTQYEIRIQACQDVGCGVGKWIYAVTDEAPPQDLSPPIIAATGSTSIEVKWCPPKKPNGKIKNYFVYRRPVGTQKKLLVFIWSEGALEFVDATDVLQPFTGYEYHVRAQNSKGSVNSLWSSTQTLEAPPWGMRAPWAQAVSAYSVLLNWTKPTSPNGPISRYRVVYQERQNDPTFNTPAVTALTLPGTLHQTHLFGLKPFTTYHIHVVAVNNAGHVSSPWTSVRTLEASPNGLRNFTVEKKENGRALLLKWAEPSKPNGDIKIYNIFSDNHLEYSGLSRQFLFRRLEPFTLYTLVLEACTVAGCTRSLPQPIWTDEAPPASQMAPVIESVNATSIGVRWSEPINSNGKIIYYEVIHRNTKENASGKNATTEKEEIVFTEYNTGSNTFVYKAEGLQPWTSYEYKIRAWNSAGYTDSAWSVAKTSQAPPKGLAPPFLKYIPGNPDKTLILWSSPEEPNGILQSYRLQRNGVPYPFSFDATTFNYTDEGLQPYSEYFYAVTACTMGGCSTSDHTSIRTLEAAPAVVSTPTIEDLSSTHVNVSWSSPQIQNGEITKYILKLNGEELYVGKSLSRKVLNLQPYTKYDLTLVACTNGGCTASASKYFWTMEAPPLNIDVPSLLVTGSESIEVTWKPPANPNGKIQMYELRRNGLLIYSGLEPRYHDFMLTPGKEYSYTVTANNSKGSITSAVAKIRTNPSSPSGMSPPRLQALSSETILVTWDPPAKVNGEIINYTITIRDPIKPENKFFHLDSSHVSFRGRSYTSAELEPYRRYEVQVQACTLLGCTSSEWASVETLEAPPEIQLAPLIDVQSSHDGVQSVLSIVWSGPKQPNGKILYYELYRRQTIPSQRNLDLVLIYNGSSTSFKDTTLLPFTGYEYQVWSVNSAGRAGSKWTQCKTGPAPPQGLHAPVFDTVASTSAVVKISPPLKPNGIVSLYRLFSNNTKGRDMVLSEGTSTQQTIHGLKPFTTYSVGVEACTCFNCCSKGPVAQVTTQPAPPSHQPPPYIHSMTSRNASFQWDAPQEPNGIVRRYELHMYSSCPPPLQPTERTCKPGPVEVKYAGNDQKSNVSDLQPYTTYKLRVVSYNSVGSTSSDWISFMTTKEVPQYKAPFTVVSNLSTIYLDWSHTFLLNGPLKEYVLMEGGQRIYSGFDTSLYLPRTSDKTYLFQISCTTDEGSAITPVIKYNTAAGLGPILTTPGRNHEAEKKEATFYTELWFVVLMAILGLILLAIFLSAILHRKISKQPYARERPPLVPLQKRMSPMSVYSQGETHMGLADTKIPGPASPTSIRSSRSTSVLQVPSQIQHTFSQGSLHRSVSQLIDVYDKKSLIEDTVWDTIIHGHNSGLYVDDDDLVTAIKGFSTVTKEHTTFTDTHL
ncbi:LOW QUALITY PROTEIN: usherin [Sceloporus undulatus]|uniref:LOW QUALITY PROTEIN: usherin n=1 Tax=Sceloporus undulatus TaxID=8520 RepID=UPI001C4B58FF|nr:LOW QUALITY PROTEIN: usherin [Sceloporus undulatus]